MQDTHQVLVAVIFALVMVIGILVYDREHRPETLGEKVGQTLDRAADDFGRALDENSRRRR